MTASAVLDRLEKVRKNGAGKWTACCPAHKDRSPSLSIRELDDGRVLLHCHAGCGVEDVLGAIGLDFEALYPPRAIDHRCTRVPKPWRAADVIEAFRREILVAWVLLADVEAGRPASDEDRERARLCLDRMAALAEELTHAY